LQPTRLFPRHHRFSMKGLRMDSEKLKLPAPETLFAATMYLATNYARCGCPMLCRMIVRQLACIENHPSADVPQSLRETCGKLRGEWERIGIERAQALRQTATGHGDAARLLH
jgi:hypothetical protein